jgi:DNA polymerase/3'-5' exonuclease PolX
MKRTIHRRIPKVLSDELEAALLAVEDLGHETFMELLARFRRGRTRCIAAWGILNIGAPVDGLESIPLEQLRNIERLDEAFQKLHKFRNGGAGDYVAADVEKAINRLRAQGPRKRTNDYEEICCWLRRRGYETSESKKDLRADAAKHFSTSEATIKRASSAGGLARKKQVTVT